MDIVTPVPTCRIWWPSRNHAGTLTYMDGKGLSTAALDNPRLNTEYVVTSCYVDVRIVFTCMYVRVCMCVCVPIIGVEGPHSQMYKSHKGLCLTIKHTHK